MAINNAESIKKKYSLEHMANMGFDEQFQLPAFELVGYDPLSNSMKRVTTNALGEYGTNDIDEGTPLTYIGKEDPAGDWYVQRIDTTSGTSLRYATAQNNVSTTDYATAWSNRASLTYGTYSQAF